MKHDSKIWDCEKNMMYTLKLFNIIFKVSL